ncbi:unnamed protein product [Porites lobata]|uniref:MARVEL domain-containing protein n=1 Tax=Porites lobata TaxID=104759 RepID=A0ABN8QGC3_9CNID|nr:unnamed protein product [Porites lobata]
MQQPVIGQQFEHDKSQGHVPLNQPVVPVTGQPVLAPSATGQPVIAMPVSGQSVLAAPPPGQQMMYQVPPGQQQPVFVQAIPGQHVMLPQGSPIQYYVPPGGQPAVQQPQQVQMLQPVQGQGVPVQPQPRQDPEMAPITINKAYLRSHLGVSRVSELLILLGAWVCIVIYSKRTFSLDGRANFFRGITIFCWVMAIIYNIVYIFGLNKSKACFGQPSNFTIMSLALQVLLTILLISCTASLTVRAVQLSKWFGESSHDSTGMYYKSMVDEYKINAAIVIVALIFGYLACLEFLNDIHYLVIIFRQERAQEAGGGPSQLAQQPGNIEQPQVVTVITQPTNLSQATQQETPKTKEDSQL